MQRREFLKTAGACMASAVLPMDLVANTIPPIIKPNIIFIMADDLGYGDLGCYGQKKIKTPNIDRIAKEGMRFTQAYAGSSVCAPSRCSLMTGMHNGHNRLRDNLPNGVWLRPDDFTIAELLKQAGYRTGGIGKWSLGIPGSWGVPNYQGFDYYYGQLNQNQAHFYYPDYVWENDKVVLLQKLVIENEVGKIMGNRGGKNVFYTHDLYTEKALNFIEKNREHPFFLYSAYTIPHFSDYPVESDDHFQVPSDEPYSGKEWPQSAKNYAAMITRMDKDVGKLMRLLKKQGIDSNTLVIFTSDNGPYQGSPIPIDFFDSNGVYRGGKRDLYEGGIRVPFVARWPGNIQADMVSDQMIAFWDVMPTLAELAGLNLPKDVDGVSFLPTLKGEKQQQPRYLFWDYGHVRKTYKRALRMEDYKGVSITDKDFELYNLKDDPGETENIADKRPDIVRKINAYMIEARGDSEDYPIRETQK